MPGQNSVVAAYDSHVAAEQAACRTESNISRDQSRRLVHQGVFLTLAESPAICMKTHGEIESAISEGMSRFEQEFMGRRPRDAHAYVINELVVVQLKSTLTAAEQHLVTTLPSEKGRDLLKQVRRHLMEVARSKLEAMIQEIAGAKVLSLHHDISTVTGEEIVVFTLASPPRFREAKKR